jgi:hypothetical protein
MRKAASVLGFALLLLIAGVTEAPAIAFNTIGGIGSCTPACPGGFVPITPHPAWTPNNPGGSTAVWISYDNTGVGPGSFVVAPDVAPPLTPANASATFEMAIPAGAVSLSLLVWADDTAGVRLDDGAAYLLAPFAVQGSACAAGGPTCTGAGTPLVIPLDGLAHTIQFDTFQRGAVTFGLMVAGDLTLAPVPEPATLLLVGSTLAALGVVSRRRLQKKQLS